MSELVFWSALALIVYTFAGYPLLIHALARIAPRPVRHGIYQPRVAIVIVGHNECTRVAPKIETCLSQDYPADRLRILFVSDGSTDGTDDAVRSIGDERVSLLSFAQRRGKAACLNDAVSVCDEEVLVFTDARQRLSSNAVSRLTGALYDPEVGAVSGELMFAREGLSSFGEGVDAYWRYEKLIRRSEALVHSVPGATGALYAVRRECLSQIDPQAILDDVAIPMQVVLQGRRVVFEPEAHAYDHPSSNAQQERARKVRTIAGNFQLIGLYPQLLSPFHNPIFLQFVSHKVLRLVGPWAMAALFASNIVLVSESAWFASSLAFQTALYSLPMIGTLFPALSRRRVVRVGTAFLALNWFAVLGLWHFAFKRDTHLWQSAMTSPSKAASQ